MKLLVPSRPKQSSEEPMSSRLSERITKHYYGSVGLLQFHTTIYKHIPIWILISKRVGMLSSGQTMAEKKKKKKLLRSLRQKSRGEVLLSCTQRSKHRVQGQKKREAVIILSFRETLMSFSGCLVLGFILLFLMSGQHPFTAHRQRFVRHITPDGYLEIEGK